VNRIGVSLGAAPAALWPVLARAAGAEGDGGVEHAAEAAHASPNLFSVDPGLLIWTIVTFVVVLLVLRATAWKPLVKSLEDRQRNIEGAIEDARRIKTEAETLLARYEETMRSAKDEARAIVDEARADGRRVQEGIRAAAEKEATEFKARAMREIDLQKDAAIQEIWSLTADLSTDLAGRILGRQLDGPDQERLVQELIAQMRREVGATGAGARS